MADTDLPNGYGAIDRPSGPSRPPRPIASPFGMLSNPWATPDPNQTPGFNVQPDTPSTQANPMASLLASFMPSGQDMKQSLAENLGVPVDAIGMGCIKYGLPSAGRRSAMAAMDTLNRAAGNRRGRLGPSVPLSSQNIRDMIDNAPSWNAWLQALRRPGLF